MKSVRVNKKIQKRMDIEIIVDAYCKEERAMGWYYYLEYQLIFPFKAKCINKRTISPLKINEEVIVIDMADESECSNEMFVIIEWRRDKLAVPLAQLKGVKVSLDAQQAIADWHYWVERDYSF